ncbi:hypothetical protein IWW37_001305 [Coemansia sp. RSA 2050]|nr:hypothetical protein IWW37_001305 [Coemansia sp. RSA 2050]KAJ2735793.1 hypothetical protein IW152_001265 [Coemansia sp. BCRC 34962]
MAITGSSHRIAHALPRATGRPRQTDSMESRASSSEQLPTATAPIAMDLHDKPVAPKDSEAQLTTHYDTRSHDAPALSPGKATDPMPVTHKSASATRATTAHTARRGRPRKAASYSTARSTVNATRSDTENEGRASEPTDAIGKRARTRRKAKALANHSSDSSYHSDEDEEPAVQQSHPQGRSHGHPPKNSRIGNSTRLVAPSKPIAVQSSDEENSSDEVARPPRDMSAKWKTSNVYVEVLVDGQGDESDRSDAIDLAQLSANTPLDVATHASTDSVAIIDSNPLPTDSPAYHSGDEEYGKDDSFLSEDNLANGQPLAGPGSVADLTVLDYLSQRVIDEVNTVVQGLDDRLGVASLPNASFRRLDCYAREQVLIRKHHFTRELFLICEHRPVDEDDIVQWASSLQRVNMATFLLLVLRPLIAVAKPVSSSLPNRERMISSMGLKAAAQGFFANVVPANLRSAETVDLLVDLVTQHVLAAANDEKHLLMLVADMRNIDDAGIAKLLAIEDYDTGNDTGQLDSRHFDVYSVPHYRKELERRLNRISGGKLHITRSQYPLHALWKKVLPFFSQCASSWRVPSILSDMYGKQADTSLAAPSSADEADEADEYENNAAEGEQDISLDGEQDAECQTTDDPNAMEEAEPMTNGPSTDVAPIDSSFKEERRVATLLRDVQDDAHLEELIEAIDVEHIDISDLQIQNRTPRRIHPARRHVFAQVPSRPIDGDNSSDDSPAFRMDVDEGAEASHNDSEFRPGAEEGTEASDNSSAFRLGAEEGAGASDDDSEFQLDVEEDAEASVPDSPYGQAVSGRSRSVNLPRRLGKRRVDSDSSSESDLDEEELRMAQRIVETIRIPPKRSRQSDDLRGRRGIAAEDMSDLVADRSGRIEFTPSASNSPASVSGRRGNTSSSGRSTLSAEYESLGQYRPLKLVRNRPTQAANAGGSSRRGNHSDQGDYSDADHGTAGKREKPVQHRVRWTEAEEVCLVRALTEFGPQWALILQHYGEGGSRSRVLQRRTRRNLKDKARNIKLRLMRENRPLGPFACVTG